MTEDARLETAVDTPSWPPKLAKKRVKEVCSLPAQISANFPPRLPRPLEIASNISYQTVQEWRNTRNRRNTNRRLKRVAQKKADALGAGEDV